jgi:hypothetical protein
VKPFKLVKIGIYKTTILLVVLFGCENWSLILSKEHRLRVFENRVLRRIFGPSIIRIIKTRRVKLAGHVAREEERV